MAEKDDRENLGDDLGQWQLQFLLASAQSFFLHFRIEGIAFARMIESNDAISDMIFSFLLLTVSAPAETGPTGENKEVSVTSKIGYVHHVPA